MTAIEWTDTTWNPVTGCTKVSAGCKHCYAETVAERFWAKQYRQVIDRVSLIPRPRRFTDVQCHEDRLLAPLGWRKPRRVFVNSMSDLFHDDVPDEFIDRVFAVMALTPQHTYQVLTKRPERMLRYMDGLSRYPEGHCWDSALRSFRVFVAGSATKSADIPLPNVWLGVSCEDQETADERIPLLLHTLAAVRFVSAEPLLGPVSLKAHMPKPMFFCAGCGIEKFRPYCSPCGRDLETVTNEIVGLDWVIVGGESGPKAMPCDVAWIRSIVQQCRVSGVPVFTKQLGARPIGGREGVVGLRWSQLDASDRGHGDNHVAIRLQDRKGGDPSEWPEDLRVREWP